MANFDFISDDLLRKMIERDDKELKLCLEVGAAKSALLLSGSIIEAILVDYFLAFPLKGQSVEQILRASLETLIGWAHQERLITSRTKDLSSVLRDYRNLIHPGKEFRIKEHVDIHSANVAAGLLEIVVQDIQKNYTEKLGYKSEQAIRKIRLDPNCSSAIFSIIVEKMSMVERIRLLQKIPLEVIQDRTISNDILSAFISMYSLLTEKIPHEFLRQEASKVCYYIEHRTKFEVLVFLRFTLFTYDLLDLEEKTAVMEYFFRDLEAPTKEYLDLAMKLNLYLYFRRIEGEYQTQLLMMFMYNSVVQGLEDEDQCFNFFYGGFYQLDKELRSAILGEIDKIFDGDVDDIKKWRERLRKRVWDK